MAEWTRSTLWRQGSILDQEVFPELAQRSSTPFHKADFAVVVSHDCDIAANPAIEPVVEVIPGIFLTKGDGSLTHAKEARKLHLAVSQIGADHQLFAEFKATDKFNISKEQLVDLVPSAKHFIAAKGLQILRRWLAARYRRHAFSDAFEKCFDKVEEKFRDILKKSSHHLRAVLFDLDEDASGDLANQDAPHILDIYLVYTSEANTAESLRVAQATKAKIEKAFQDKYKHSGQWKEIELRSCEVISDNALTYAQYLQLVEWRSEGLSLRSDPPGPMTEENS
jgi:hypothetical protein